MPSKDSFRKVCNNSFFLLKRFDKEHPDRNSLGQRKPVDLHGVVLFWGLAEPVDETTKRCSEGRVLRRIWAY